MNILLTSKIEVAFVLLKFGLSSSKKVVLFASMKAL